MTKPDLTPGSYINDKYFKEREHLNYYQAIRYEMDALGYTKYKSVLDVGYGGTDLVTYGKYQSRMTIDRRRAKEYPNVVHRIADYQTYSLKADVILCCQVIEHLPDNQVYDFCKKLLKESKALIVSVPYKWPRGTCKYHLQDPIDEAKLKALMNGREPNVSYVVDDGLKRLVTVYLEKRDNFQLSRDLQIPY